MHAGSSKFVVHWVGCIMSDFPALDWFDAAIAREKDARRAKGMSEELGEDIIRPLGESARRLFPN